MIVFNRRIFEMWGELKLFTLFCLKFTRKRGVAFYSTIISCIHSAVGEIKRSSIAFDGTSWRDVYACARMHSKIQVLHCVQCALAHRHIYLVALFCHRLCTDSGTIHDAVRVTCNNMDYGINVSLVHGPSFGTRWGISIFDNKKAEKKRAHRNTP